MSINKKLDKCIAEGQRGGERHKGLKKIPVSKEKIKGHLDKATHNLNAIIDFKKNGYSDWSASASFYTLYHCLLAIIAKKGYESRNQSCTFAFVEDMINKGGISITLADLKEIFDQDIIENLEHSDKILDLRENMQYSIKTNLEEMQFQILLNKTKNLFDKLKREIEK